MTISQTVVDYGAARTQEGNRAVARLSNGNSVVISQSDAFVMSVRYVVRGGGSSVVQESVTGLPLSIAADDTDNLHVVFVNLGDITLRYIKYTKGAGYTWTAGTSEIVFTMAALGDIIGRADIDVLDSGAIAIAWLVKPEAQTFTQFKMRVRHTSGGWGTQYSVNGVSNEFHVRMACSIARNHGTVSGGTQQVMYLRMLNTNAAGATLGYVSVNLSTGAITGDTVIDAAFGSSSYVVGLLFALAANDWAVLAVSGNPGFAQSGVAARLNATAYTKAPVSKVAASGLEWDAGGRHTYVFGVTSGTHFKAGVIGTRSKNTDHINLLHCNLDTAAITWAGSLYGVTAGGTTEPCSGAGRHYNSYIDIRGRNLTTHDIILTYNELPAAPSVFTPANTSIVSTDLPELTVTLYAGDSYRRGYWQLATNPTFTTNSRFVEDDDAGWITTGIARQNVPGVAELFTGEWYLRAYVVDAWGNRSAPSFGIAFSVFHPPSAIATFPIGGAAVIYGASGDITFTWGFSDPSPVDFQTAFQLIVQVVDTLEVIYNSGQIVQLASSHFTSINVAYENVPLRWYLVVYDSDSISSAPSTPAAFTMAGAPTVAIDSPTSGGTITNPQPTITWTTSLPAGRTQAGFRVFIYDNTGLNLIYDSGNIAGAGDSHTVSSPVLVNAKDYSVKVTVTDNVGLTGSDTNLFDTAWTPPDPTVGTVVDISTFDTDGEVTITWAITDQDADFIEYRIYRREVGDTGKGELLGTTAGLTFTDLTAKSNVEQEWTVVQTADTFGSPVESTPAYVAATPVTTHYWLIDPVDTDLSTILYNVTADSFVDEYETATLKVIGRGRRMEYGTHFGKSGTLTLQIRDQTGGITAGYQIDRIELIKTQLRDMYLRDPFGHMFLVATDSISMTRIPGMGLQEAMDVTIPYIEISEAST